MGKIINKKFCEEIRVSKQLALEKAEYIINEICKNNQHIFKKAPVFRVKEVDSIFYKIRDKKIDNVKKFNREVRDIAGGRLVCCTLDEIDEVVKLIHKHPDVLHVKPIKDYKAGADEDGYRAHHLMIKVQFTNKSNKIVYDECEVQIRTLMQDSWAILSHRDLYKNKYIPSEHIKKDMLALSNLCAVVDELAYSLKERLKDETNKMVEEKSRKIKDKDKITNDNIIKLIKKLFNINLSDDFVYKIIRYLLDRGVTSIKLYQDILKNKKYAKIVTQTFAKYNKKPLLSDKLLAPVYIYKYNEIKFDEIVRADLERPEVKKTREKYSRKKRNKRK